MQKTRIQTDKEANKSKTEYWNSHDLNNLQTKDKIRKIPV